MRLLRSSIFGSWSVMDDFAASFSALAQLTRFASFRSAPSARSDAPPRRRNSSASAASTSVMSRLGAYRRVIPPRIATNDEYLLVILSRTPLYHFDFDQAQDGALATSPWARHAQGDRIEQVVEHSFDRSLGHSAKRQHVNCRRLVRPESNRRRHEDPPSIIKSGPSITGQAGRLISIGAEASQRPGVGVRLTRPVQ